MGNDNAITKVFPIDFQNILSLKTSTKLLMLLNVPLAMSPLPGILINAITIAITNGINPNSAKPTTGINAISNPLMFSVLPLFLRLL